MQAVKQLIKKYFSGWIYRRQKAAARRTELENHVKLWTEKSAAKLSDTSFDVFTYHGEDGILAYLVSRIKDIPPTFIDIGSGDCIKSNCASLAFHFNWEGVFIDKNEQQLAIGKGFYKKKIQHGAAIFFEAAEVSAENINQLLMEKVGKKPTGLLSIDIDGNDYWIWKAIECIQPEIVVVEAKAEFGYKDVVVPYGPHNHHSVDDMYNGASVEALQKIGMAKGYKLVGANKQGYNLFFVKEATPVQEVSARSVLDDPETVRSFYPESLFASHTFEIK